jgi:hypothetical protein
MPVIYLSTGITDGTQQVTGVFVQNGSTWVSPLGCETDNGCYTITYDGNHWQLTGGSSGNNQATGGTNPDDPTGAYTTNNLPVVNHGILFSNDGLPGWNDNPETSRFVIIWNWGGWATDIWALADNRNGGATLATASGIGDDPASNPVVTWVGPNPLYTSEAHPFNLVLTANANPWIFDIASFQAVDPTHDGAILTAEDLGGGFSYAGAARFSGSARMAWQESIPSNCQESIRCKIGYIIQCVPMLHIGNAWLPAITCCTQNILRSR